MRVYLDVCCLNRPFDDQTQDRIHLESEAVLLVLKRIMSGDWRWISSEVVDFEIDQTPDAERRSRTRLVAQRARYKVLVQESVIVRALELETMGFGPFDALHLACAERGHADVFLTTDDRLLAVALRNTGRLELKVRNPLSWLREVMDDEGAKLDS